MLMMTLSSASCRKTVGSGSTAQLCMDVTVPENFASNMIRVFAFDSSDGRKAGEMFLSDRSSDTFSHNSAFRSGHYEFVAYNFDIPDTFLRGESDIRTLEIFTKPVSDEILSRFILGENGTVVYAPDRVILGESYASLAGGDCGHLSIAAGELTENWQLEVGADGAGYAALAGCILTNEKISWSHSGSVGSGSIYFDLQRQASTLAGNFNTFGHGDMSSASITVFVNNGEKILNYTKSVGELMKEASRSGSHKIVIDDRIVIPAPANVSQGGGGFSPSVGEWKTESGEILI